MPRAERERVEVRPQPGPQEDFLSSPADIAIYGGSAGGGKSFALLLDPLRHARVPGFRAVIFRRHSPELTNPGGLWDESMALYGPAGATPNRVDLHWDFKGGGRVKLGHLQHDQTVLSWHSSQIAWLGFDELTTFSSHQFWYMLSRNRTTCGVRPCVRAACNPDPDSWVRDFIRWWIDDDTGLPIPERSGVLRYFVRVGDRLHWADSPGELLSEFPELPEVAPRSVTFVPATLQDNRILMAKDPNYLANLLAQPGVIRERLLSGNWNARATGGQFQRGWFKRYVEAGEYWRLLERGNVRKDQCWTFLTVDSAASVSTKADHTVVCTWAVTPRSDLLLVAVERFKLEIPDIAPRVLAAYERAALLSSPARFVAVEAVYSNVAVAQHCERLPMVVKRVSPQGRDKLMRATPAILFCESGRLWLPEDAPWLRAWEAEHCNFTGDDKFDESDDQVDNTSYAVECLTRHRPSAPPRQVGAVRVRH